jgi:hypothetical protein
MTHIIFHLIQFINTAKDKFSNQFEKLALILRTYLQQLNFDDDAILLIFEVLVEIAFEEDDNNRSEMLSILLSSHKLAMLNDYRLVISAAISSY